MRSYSSLLVFESVFDSMDQVDKDLVSLANQVFSPTVRIVEDDCGTLLGEMIDVNFEAEGRVELSTDLPLSRTRIIDLLSNGVYQVFVRTLATCISDGGVCAKCYAASRPDASPKAVGDRVEVAPLFERSTEVLYTSAPSDSLSLSVPSDTYESILLFRNGSLVPASSYTVDGDTLQMSEPVPADTYLVTRYITTTRAPYLLYLAETYSGSLLGIKALPRPLLSVRPKLLVENISQGLLEDVVQVTKKFKAIPPNMLEYLSNTHDALEKALFVIALRTIYASTQ